MSHEVQEALPQEIFDNIIDHFHEDPPTLRVLGVVSSSWLSSARAHLFHRIELHPPLHSNQPTGIGQFFHVGHKTRTSPCKRLLDALEASQSIRFQSRLGGLATHVREIYLDEGMLKREWLAHEPALPLLLRSLHNLRRFEITRSSSVGIAWSRLPLEAIEHHVLRLPSLTELHLGSLLFESVEDLARVLRACERLRVLEVEHVSFKDDVNVRKRLDGTVDSQGGVVQASLDTLVIGPRTSTVVIAYLLHPSSAVAVNTVRKLSMSISGNFADFAKLLHASLSVEELEVVLMNDIDLQEYWKLSPSDHFDLSQVPHLQDLKINIDVLQKLDDPLPWLYALLLTGTYIHSSRMKRANAIQAIWIIYSLYLPAPYMDKSVNTAIFDRWRDIDAVLSGTEQAGKELNLDLKNRSGHAYENLENVKLDFMLENPIGYGVAPRFLKEVVLDSPGLERLDTLRVNAFDTS